ncbi:MAG: hypothetical protein JSW60_08590, partial [Thermoplasmatales archaeon]
MGIIKCGLFKKGLEVGISALLIVVVFAPSIYASTSDIYSDNEFTEVVSLAGQSSISKRTNIVNNCIYAASKAKLAEETFSRIKNINDISGKEP